MVDAETNQEWEKSRRIEEERMKAMRDLNVRSANGKASVGAAFLDPSLTHKKGYRRDPDAIMMSTEKFANASVVLAVAGVILSIIGMAGGAVSQMNELGAGGAIISGLPSGLGIFCLGVAVICAFIGLISSFAFRKKISNKSSSAIWTSVIALVIVGIYFMIKMVLRI